MCLALQLILGHSYMSRTTAKRTTYTETINLLDRPIQYHHAMNEHRRLTLEVSTLISSFEAFLTVPIPDNTDELVKARVALVQSVNAYIANLGAQVSGAANDPHISSWKEAHNQVVQLRGRYSEHIGRFSSSMIKANWPAYRSSSQYLITAMRDHLNRVTALTPIRP